MNKQSFLKLFGADHLFSAYDYQKVMPPLGNITNIRELRSLNREGYCIFFAVNSMKGGRRSNKNVKSIRAIWIDDDNPRVNPRKRFPIPPSIVVQTSAHEVDDKIKYKYQYYWLTSTTNFDEFELVMQTMIDKYGNDKGVRDKARVLRIPGFNHMKDRDNPFRVKVVGGNNKKYDWEVVTLSFPPAKELVSSTKVKGKYNRTKAKEAIKDADDYHGSLRDRAMELANKRLGIDEIIALLEADMNQVAGEDRDKRWRDRMSLTHLMECAESAVAKYEGEGHEDGDDYNIVRVGSESHHVTSPKLPLDVIAPPNTIIGALTNELYKTWWVPNIMVAGLAARSMVAYLAGGKYRSNLGDRVNIQQVAIGETGCGKDLLFNQFSSMLDLSITDKDTKMKLARGVVDEVGSAEGMDMKLRTCGEKHDIIWLQDEIGGLMQVAKKDSRKQDILSMLLKFYTKSDEIVNERALVKRLPEGAAEILYAPHINLSGATTPSLITRGLDHTFLEYGSASRMVFFPVTQYVEELSRSREELKLPNKVKNSLKKIPIQKSHGIFKYPYSRVREPVKVVFNEEAADLAHEENVRTRNDTKLNQNVWNRYVANAKKYAMIDAIAENPRRPVVDKEILQRNLTIIAASCQYTCDLFANEVGETEHDTAKNKIKIMMEKHLKKGHVIRMSDINNMGAMRRLKPNERYSLIKEMESEGSIVKIEKENVRGKPTITFRLA